MNRYIRAVSMLEGPYINRSNKNITINGSQSLKLNYLFKKKIIKLNTHINTTLTIKLILYKVKSATLREAI